MHVAIVYSTPSTQYQSTNFIVADEDTLLSAQQIAAALKKKGIRASLVPVSIDTVERVIASIKADCIFSLIEWSGDDLPYALFAYALMEKSGIPFTGATTANFHLVSDKVLMKKAFDRLNIPTPQWRLFFTGEESVDGIQCPVIIKPAMQHCSIGLSRDMIVKDPKKLRAQIKKQMRRFKQSVYVEEFIVGREFHVPVLEMDGKPRVLPPIEITFNVQGTEAFLTYESRWDPEHPDYQQSDIGLPKTYDPQLMNKIKKICERIFTILDYRDYMRVDIRVRGNDVFILEANCNPGLGDDEESAIPIACKTIGMSFEDYIWAIVESCMRRWGKGVEVKEV